MTRILSREGARPWVSRFFFKVFVQSVLLFGVETWVVTPHMGRVLWGFQDEVLQQLMGWLPRRQTDGKREYNFLEAGFETMETYIRRR